MKKIEKLLFNFVKNDGLTFILSFIVFIILLMCFEDTETIIDYPVFSSVMITLLFQKIIDLLKKTILKKMEDKIKLTEDYESLNKQYSKTDNLITYDNIGTKYEKWCFKHYKKVKFTFPVCCDYILEDLSVKIKDSKDKYYKAPDYILYNFDKFISAHRMSTIYNNLNIRVDNWYVKNYEFVMETSRTTYFDSMSTNRVMDYLLDNDISVRKMYEYGSAITPLNCSQLSNHLGFNAFVESSDGKILFIKRSDKVSTGKYTYGSSIGASLKTKYVLNANGEFKIESFGKGIVAEIEDELSISADKIEKIENKDFCVLAAYRDLVEGGKPQLLVYAKSALDSYQISDQFNKTKKEKSKTMKSDGKKIVWIPKEELMKITVMPNGIMYNGKFMRMVASTSASLTIFINYLKKEAKKQGGVI